ncbi:MAG: 5'-methylthioadenosine/S-adenosylhomocysteine nucleosidase [Spirochaetales bacterium]|nr:5'-methylthioadenosine/S-adenosylhomocysteine nucleosidase [Spirochaetales bacterium]
MNTTLDTIGIIGAMEEEIELLKKKIGPLGSYTRGGNTFYIGELHGLKIVLLKSGIGKVNATIGATLLMSRYNPICIINTGSAGAVFRDLEIGDVVISSDVVHHDVDVTAFDYAYGQVPQMPPTFLPHEDLIKMAEDAAKQLPGINVSRAGIATGDSFMNDQDEIQKIRDLFPTVAAIEMEAAAIAQTCHQFNKPFVIIRAISDKADAGAAVSFETFIKKAADNSAKMVLEMILELKGYIDQKEYERSLEAE